MSAVICRTSVCEIGVIPDRLVKTPAAGTICDREGANTTRVSPELCGRTAEGAWERRSHVGSHDLLGRLVGQFLSGRRAYPRRRIDQTAVVDNLFDLRAVQGLVLEQG